MTTLEIRHRLALRDGKLIVTENFGDRETEWEEPSVTAAEATIAKRKTILLDMVANISPAAKRAVKEAQHIDRLKPGHG